VSRYRETARRAAAGLPWDAYAARAGEYASGEWVFFLGSATRGISTATCRSCAGTGVRQRNVNAPHQVARRERLYRQMVAARECGDNAAALRAELAYAAALAREFACPICRGRGTHRSSRRRTFAAAVLREARRRGWANAVVDWYYGNLHLFRRAPEDGPWLTRLREWETSNGGTTDAPS
jgi:hypothetical protein